ncbi:MAG: hypothetical protein R3D88_03760 [Alphaproteobacteria bacterium]
MPKNKILILTLFIGTLALGACSNTFNGAGRDIEGAGEWIQDTF